MERRGENHVINFRNILMNNGGQANCLKFFLLSVLSDILGGQLNLLSIDRLFLICIYIIRFGMFLEKERIFSNMPLLECIYFYRIKN